MTPDGPAAEDLETLRRQAADLQAEVAGYRAAAKGAHHRVKNHLQVVSSLLHLQAAQLDDPAGRAALGSSEGRVGALALIHDAVCQSEDLARIDLVPHLERLGAQLVRSHQTDPGRVQLVVQAGAAPIDLDRAVSATLIVHELVSNSLRYAFPDGRAGSITVAVEQDADGRCMLTVSDDGVGLPPGLDVQQTRTLGLRLVAALAEQLGGSVTVDRAAGTNFRIAFPDRPITGGDP